MRLLVVAMLLVVPLSGCILDDLMRPDIAVSRTDLGKTNEFGYVTTNVFSVSVLDPGGADVVITAKSDDGQVITSEGLATQSDLVSVTLSDGTWTVSYTVDGHDWETFKDVRIDGTPPDATGIRKFANASQGSYTIGASYVLAPDTTVTITDGDGRIVGSTMPTTVTGLTDGVHFFVVVLQDQAGNTASVTVQVAAGDAKLLPEGDHTFGIVARYTNDARLWDLSRMGSYVTPAQARSATGGAWLGSGFGITPDDPEVQAVADEVVSPDDTTMEAAFDVFVWLMDELEYDDERLASSTLMLPRQVILDGEDPDASQDDDEDGLADDGPGNGIKGGVCRDLAATYVSVLRAAGIPARLVSGYLAGNVDGFHAWAEVYVGSVDGASPWMPVDVSPIDGRYSGDADQDGLEDGLNTAVQAFGIALPQYLALRKIPESSEDEGWSTALGTSYTYPQGHPPELTFEKELTDVGQPVEGLLCFDPDSLERRLATRTNECQGMYVIGRDSSDPQFRDAQPFIVGTQRVIDYGISLQSAASDTTIELSLSYPFPEDVSPDRVEYAPYSNIPSGYRFTQEDPDPASGTIQATLRR